MISKFIQFTDDELLELRCGLGWSSSEDCEINPSLNEELHDTIEFELRNRGVKQ